MIQNNLVGAFWQPCDQDAPDSIDLLTLTYTDGSTVLVGEDARRAIERLFKRSLTRQFALTLTPDNQGEVAA